MREQEYSRTVSFSPRSTDDLPARQKVVDSTCVLLQKAESHYETTMPMVTIRFDLRGHSAGMACFRAGTDPLIRYNALLHFENQEEFLSQTVPHEVAHVVTRVIWGPRVQPHGLEWQSVMALFGAKAQRCHDFDTSRSRARRLKRFTYRCCCGEHQLTSIRHNRAHAGQVYLCRSCGTPLKPGAGNPAKT
ncbi:MAG: hypothetical protein GY703_03100 [Gammaproteobacteria bacterium]|nr:hypothetical protein [Gammaproteobacteria bacterium]